MSVEVASPRLTTSRADRRSWVVLHLAFAVVAVVLLSSPVASKGWRVLAAVVAYHVMVVGWARYTGQEALWRAWTILAPLSVLMVLPDWFLSEVLGVLEFPDSGGPFIGDVPLAMAGMWTIALMPVVGCAMAAEQRRGMTAGIAAAATTGLAVFVFAELAAPYLDLWKPVGVATIAGIATYVLIPEVVLSVCAYLLVSSSRWLSTAATALLTGLLPFTYLGLLAVSYQFMNSPS